MGRLSRDIRLDAAARDLAKSYQATDPISAKTITAVAHHHGYPFPEFSLLFLSASAGSTPDDLAPLRKDIAVWQSSLEAGRFGVGQVDAPEGLRILLLATSARVDFTPVPRSVGRGTIVALAGRVHAPYARPEVFVTTPAGTVEHLFNAKSGDRFEAHLPCGEPTGEYRVEITGSTAAGPRPLAIFPVYCGIPAPRGIDVQKGVKPATETVADVEAGILTLLNRERRQRGLRELSAHARLTRVAKEYSSEMANTESVEHISPRSGMVLDRVRRSGIQERPTLLGENIARVYSAEEAHQGFLDSPGHRANMLNPAFTHVGIGAVAKDETSGHRAFYITEVFAAF